MQYAIDISTTTGRTTVVKLIRGVGGRGLTLLCAERIFKPILQYRYPYNYLINNAIIILTVANNNIKIQLCHLNTCTHLNSSIYARKADIYMNAQVNYIDLCLY